MRKKFGILGVCETKLKRMGEELFGNKSRYECGGRNRVRQERE